MKNERGAAVAGAVIVCLILAGVFTLTSMLSNWNIGSGEKVGTVIKLAQEGAFHKTWEAEIVRGGMNNGSGAFSMTPLHLTITDPNTLAKVQDAFDNQYEVKVKYTSMMFAPWASEHENKFATSVERLTVASPKPEDKNQ